MRVRFIAVLFAFLHLDEAVVCLVGALLLFDYDLKQDVARLGDLLLFVL